MSLLLNKRKREESVNDSNSLRNEDTSKIHQENNNINIPEDLLIEENNIDNTQKNNKLDAFQMMFQSRNSRKDDPNNNNMIFSPLCSNLFFGSFQKMKNLDKIVSSNVKSGIILSKSNSSIFKNKKNNKMFFTPSALEMENNFNFETLFNNNNNNNEKMQLNLDFDFFNLSEKKNIYDLNNDINIKPNEDMNNNNISNNINDIFSIKPTNNFFENIKNINNDSFGLNENSIEKNNENERNIQTQKEEKNNIEIQIDTSIFSSSKLNDNNNNSSKTQKGKNIKNKYSYQNILRPKNVDTFFTFKRPFRTFHTKLINKTSHQIQIKKKSNKPKIFHIEKIFNKREYQEVNEKDEMHSRNNNKLIDKYKISLKKIKQIYLNSCLKIYSYLTDKNTFSENNLNNESYISGIIHQVSEIIRNRKISSSKMNEILQVSDDDKYRKHYFMFSSEAKQFCLDLISKKKYPLDITMKMCKVPRKSLRRWSHVGCLRKKGCGRKTKNPKMEEQLVQWYNEAIKRNVNITAKMIRDKAVQISNDKDFLASKGWLEKFKKKNGIQIINNKRLRKYDSIDMETNSINYNNTINNSIKNNSNYFSKNDNEKDNKDKEKDKENEKVDYEINIINENHQGKLVNEEKNDIDIILPLDKEFHGKENTNSNIINDIES